MNFNSKIPREKPSDSQLILDSIRRIVRALRISSCAAEKELGLSGAQLYVLQTLNDGKEISVNELAARTLTDQSSVSVVVTKLLGHQLVLRKKSKLDARKVLISITPKGRTLLKRGPHPIQERLVHAIENLPHPTRLKLSEALAEVVRLAGISEGPAPLFFEEKESRARARVYQPRARAYQPRARRS